MLKNTGNDTQITKKQAPYIRKTEPTIFRKYGDGEVVALFVESAYGLNPDVCTMRSNAEGGTIVGNPLVVIQTTKPAKEADYVDLLKELTAIGYNIQVIQKHYRRHRDLRKQKIEHWKQALNKMP